MTSEHLQIEQLQSDLVDMIKRKDFYKKSCDSANKEIEKLIEEVEHVKWVCDAKQGKINHLEKEILELKKALVIYGAPAHTDYPR